MESVGWIAAVRARVGERADDAEEFRDGAGPAMRDQQRQGIRLGRPDVQEVHVLAIDFGAELRVLVKPRFSGTPVIRRSPVLRELPEVTERNTAVPADVGQFIWPASIGDPATQVSYVVVWYLDPEGLHRYPFSF